MPGETTRTCPACSTIIPAGFPAGLCPKCLLAAAHKNPGKTEPAADSAPRRNAGVPPLPTAQTLFPDLEILDLLGAGGMGAVYRARQPRLNRLTALKIMVCPPEHAADFVLRFEREAQVLARLNHPHIVTIYDFGELGPERTGADALYYFLMEYVDGRDLGQLIKSKELHPAQALAIVPQICDALQYAHDQGITHRDIKPANILIDTHGTVKIADFGLARMVSGVEETFITGLTQTGTTMGTPHYMAPEQWEHPEQVDHRADIYALGVVFYEMLTGERPAGVFDPPSRKTSEVDQELDSVVLRAMEKNPDRRYQQAVEVKKEVTRISGANQRPENPPTVNQSPLKWFAVLAAAVALAAWLFWPPTASNLDIRHWLDLDSQVIDQGDAKAASDGWLLLAKGGPNGGRIVLTGRTAHNAGLRGRFHGADFRDLKAPYLMLRASDENGIRSGIQLHLDEENKMPTVWIKRFSREHPQGADLLKRPLAAPLPPDREYTLELYLIGSRVIARCNQELFQVTLDSTSDDPGKAALIEHLGPDRFRDLQFINLDNLPEAEALKLASVIQSAPIATNALIHGGSRYTLIEGPYTWEQAKAKAQEMGGHLATLTTQEEAEAVRNFIRSHNSSQGYWLGGYGAEGSLDLYWITGEPISRHPKETMWREDHPGWRMVPTNIEVKRHGRLPAVGMAFGKNIDHMPTDLNGGWLAVQPAAKNNFGFLLESPAPAP